jgi:hypothetical protein
MAGTSTAQYRYGGISTSMRLGRKQSGSSVPERFYSGFRPVLIIRWLKKKNVSAKKCVPTSLTITVLKFGPEYLDSVFSSLNTNDDCSESEVFSVRQEKAREKWSLVDRCPCMTYWKYGGLKVVSSKHRCLRNSHQHHHIIGNQPYSATLMFLYLPPGPWPVKGGKSILV